MKAFYFKTKIFTPLFQYNFSFRMQRVLQSVGTTVGTIGFGYTLFNQCIFNVDAGCRGVVFDRFRGVLGDIYSEGKFFFQNSAIWRVHKNLPYLFNIVV